MPKLRLPRPSLALPGATPTPPTKTVIVVGFVIIVAFVIIVVIVIAIARVAFVAVFTLPDHDPAPREFFETSSVDEASYLLIV